MFLSHKYKFLYIRTRRTGSTSFLHMSLPYFSKQDGDIHLLKNPPKQDPLKEFWSVQSLLDLKIIDEKILKTYFIFAFERDMITKTISHFYQSHPIYGCCFTCYLKRGEFPIDTPFYTLADTGKNVLKYTAKYENYQKEIEFIWKRCFRRAPPEVLLHMSQSKEKKENMKVLHYDQKEYNT